MLTQEVCLSVDLSGLKLWLFATKFLRKFLLLMDWFLSYGYYSKICMPLSYQ